ncbi:MAG: hypothetical protein JSV96_17080 [Candidatus Aminicenantes bacterium]|nr:MAG: hypothetical protein JSV96_17080 [Candidatus Aminicenantes bacterium]
MKDERIIAVREKIHTEFAVAEDNLESAVLLYDSEKYRICIPLFRDSLLGGIKALLMLSSDELPEDSLLVDSYNQTEISKKIKLEVGLNEVLTKLRNAEQDSIENPLSISKESIKNLDVCYKQIENFSAQANKLIKKSLLTTKEFKKKSFIRKITITISACILAIPVLVSIISWLVSLGNGLTVSYFSDQNFENLIKTDKDKEINFDWGEGSIISDYFNNIYIRWAGRIKAPKSGEYDFMTISDDGVRVWIDDNLIIDDWQIHWNNKTRAKINLEKGYHRIRVDYFEAEGGAVIKLLWKVPRGHEHEIISSSNFRRVK